MKVFLEKEGKYLDVEFKGKTVADLLKQLNLNPQEVVVVKNDEIVLGDEPMSEQDDVKILSVISGG
ncbi:MAG: sulfur carrier protein [Candidatus Woesearchaeota archaeon]|nr:sulfur carrier protein [Candidatus Woesearchaeota archaeon]